MQGGGVHWSSPAYSLSDDDLRKLLPGVVITLYSDLESRGLHSLLDAQGRGLVLFVEKETPSVVAGHWLALATQRDGLLVFDPYGGKVEPWFLNSRFVSNRTLKALDEDEPMLADIIKRSGVKPIYNPHRYQVMKPEINTCGRHCVVRLWNKHLDNAAYDAFIRSIPGTPDDAVTQLTNAELQRFKGSA